MLNQILSQASSDVRVIEQASQIKEATKVGAYCRVSTDMEMQKTSLETQMMAYERIIANHPGWKLAGIYADKGISGTSVRKRNEFLRMIEDAKAGKIDYILVKSISRFSRNTVDLLQYIRDLKRCGVNVYFEKEHIDTGSSNSEFLLSIFGAAAQEEIISLSNNMKVGKRMRYAQGKIQWTHIYGFERGWKIVPEEASVIKRIYERYLAGDSLTCIRDMLNNEGIPVPTGKGRWETHTLYEILMNEKYAGHVLMQKTYVKDPITHEKVSNRNAVVRQYFKRNHHASIVNDEVWEAAKWILTLKSQKRGATQYPFYGILRCPFCGENMVRFHYSQHEFYWTCEGRGPSMIRSERSSCPPFVLHEKALLQSLINAGMPLEYWEIKQQFSVISFPKDDWNHLILTSANSVRTNLIIPISYDIPSNSPMPTICTKEYKWHFISGDKVCLTTFINDIPVPSNKAPQMLKRIHDLQAKVLNLSIQPPESYEPNVPKVDFGRTLTRKDRQK